MGFESSHPAAAGGGHEERAASPSGWLLALGSFPPPGLAFSSALGRFWAPRFWRITKYSIHQRVGDNVGDASLTFLRVFLIS